MEWNGGVDYWSGVLENFCPRCPTVENWRVFALHAWVLPNTHACRAKNCARKTRVFQSTSDMMSAAAYVGSLDYEARKRYFEKHADWAIINRLEPCTWNNTFLVKVTHDSVYIILDLYS